MDWSRQGPEPDNAELGAIGGPFSIEYGVLFCKED
jgi:hypothetical protein